MQDSGNSGQLIVQPQQLQRTRAEVAELEEKVARAHFLGHSYESIGKALNISKSYSGKLFTQWSKEHEKEWREKKSEVLVRINESFSRSLTLAEQELLDVKDTKERGAWNKQRIEILGAYLSFLRDCGYLTGQEFSSGKEEIKVEIEPLAILLANAKKVQLERVKNARN